MNALMLSLLALRGLPPAQRRHWQALFDHYVFAAGAESHAHIPDAVRGVLGPLDEGMAANVRSVVRKRLER